MIRQTLAFSLISIFSFLAVATDFSDKQPQVEVKDEIVEKIYRNAIKQSEIDSNSGKTGFNLVTGGALFEPSTMNLSNTYYDIAYSENWNSIPMVNIMFENSFFLFFSVLMKGSGGFSYSYLEKIARVKSKKSLSNSERSTFLRVHSMPIVAGFDIEYRRWIDFTPFVLAHIGTQWIYQMGTLDGLEQGFWVPFYQLGAGVTLFEPVSNSDQSWFGGLKLSILSHRSISSSQTINGLSTNLGVVLRL